MPTQNRSSNSGSGISGQHHHSALQAQMLSNRIAVINEIAAKIHQSLDTEHILAVLQEQVKWLVDFDYCSFGLVETTDELTVHILHSRHRDGEISGVESALLDYTLQAKFPQVIDSSALESGSIPTVKPLPEYEFCPYRSWLCMPVRGQGEIWGVLLLAHQQSHFYSQEDLRIVHLLATQLASAIFGARRFAEVTALYEQLAQAHHELQRAEQLRDDMMKMVIHDLRNPLNNIHICLEIIEELANAQTAATLSPHIQRAKRSSGTMYTMIKDLLTFGKLESGNFHLNYHLVEFLAVLNQVSEEWKLRAIKEQKLFQVHLPSTLPPIYCDIDLIRRVLDNLLSNAFRHTLTNDSIDLLLTLDDQYLYLHVHDTGIGIPAQHQQRIFDKFVQLTDADSEIHTRGSGLGLAFCKLIVEAHDGTIAVEATPNVGSKFTFTLPLIPALHPQVESSLPAESPV